MRTVLPLLLAVLFLACEKSAETPVGPENGSGFAAPQGGATEKADPDSGGNEQVDVPANIAGSFLTCAIRKEATEGDLETEVGCLLKDPATQRKVDSELISWTSNQVSDDLTILPQDPSSIYNVLLRLRGADLQTILEKAAALEAIAIFRGTVFKREKVYNVLKPAIELEDYEAPIVREQSIEEDDDGSL